MLTSTFMLTYCIVDTTPDGADVVEHLCGAIAHQAGNDVKKATTAALAAVLSPHNLHRLPLR